MSENPMDRCRNCSAPFDPEPGEGTDPICNGCHEEERKDFPTPRIIHDLKSWPNSFNAWDNDKKQFEFRKDDRNFQLGDTVILREYDPILKKFSGCWRMGKIKYILKGRRGASVGLQEGYCIFSLDMHTSNFIPEPEEKCESE